MIIVQDVRYVVNRKLVVFGLDVKNYLVLKECAKCRFVARRGV